MTPSDLARAAAQQREAIEAFRRETAPASTSASHTDLDYLRRAATARATRVGPGPDRPAVHQQ